jgi:N-acetylglucosamine kinase-like BadF-type ATPase
LGVSFQAVSGWERGIASPDLENLVKMAGFFGVLVDDLLRPREEVCFLGIDGGGTKTEFAVVTGDGRVLDRFVRGASNPNDVGLRAAGDLLVEGVREVLVKHPSLTAVFSGIAGAASGDHAARLTARLQEAFPSLAVTVKTDSANLFGADDGADLAVISGTGSVVFVRQGDEFLRLGGWGYLFDTAGSAYDMGRDAVSAALAHEDGLGEATLLTELIKRTLNAPTVFGSIHKLYEGGKPYIASLAPLVFEAYGQGDPAAVAIVDRTARRLAELLQTGATHYGVRKKAVAGGGLFEHFGAILLPLLETYTDVTVAVCDLPPLYGACRLSVLSAGRALPDTFGNHFKTTYEEMRS